MLEASNSSNEVAVEDAAALVAVDCMRAARKFARPEAANQCGTAAAARTAWCDAIRGDDNMEAARMNAELSMGFSAFGWAFGRPSSAGSRKIPKRGQRAPPLSTLWRPPFSVGVDTGTNQFRTKSISPTVTEHSREAAQLWNNKGSDSVSLAHYSASTCLSDVRDAREHRPPSHVMPLLPPGPSCMFDDRFGWTRQIVLRIPRTLVASTSPCESSKSANGPERVRSCRPALLATTPLPLPTRPRPVTAIQATPTLGHAGHAHEVRLTQPPRGRPAASLAAERTRAAAPANGRTAATPPPRGWHAGEGPGRHPSRRS